MMVLNYISKIEAVPSGRRKQALTWRRRILKSATVLLATATFLASVPLGAQAATTSPKKSHDDKTVSTTTLVANPDRLASKALFQAIDKAREVDPIGFDARVKLISSSKAVLKYVTSFKGLDRSMQIDGLAASMPTDALNGMVDLMERKIVEYKVQPASGSSNWVTMIVHKEAFQPDQATSGDLTTFGLGSLPQCPSAWAAFWAWFAFNAAFCGPFAAYPPAAFGCALGLGLAGMVIDFNRGC
ncbi:hypothetical protein ACFUOZ_18055 [Paenarthrobacter sp. NPDC057355]|uniref:hypothetical protein n=1 Tax=Paenarthrobacter sp. NPDC057355 TaxID=3346105 RepID=UPI0036357E87